MSADPKGEAVPPPGPRALHDGRYLMPPLPPWEAATWEGARYEALRAAAALTFRERLELVCAQHELAERARAAAGGASDHAAAAGSPSAAGPSAAPDVAPSPSAGQGTGASN